MTRSENINELTKALSAAQGEIKGAVKDADNPHFRSSYADLQSVWDAIREPLTKNGLAVMQFPSVSYDGEGAIVDVITTLSHVSDQWVSSTLSMPLPHPTPQAVGSAITYARRYALQSVVGVAPMDDDGEAAEGRGNAPTHTARAQERTDHRREAEARKQTPQDPVSLGNWKDVVCHIGKKGGPLLGKKIGGLDEGSRAWLLKTLREKDQSRLVAADKRLLAALCIWEGEQGVGQRPAEEQAQANAPANGNRDALETEIRGLMEWNAISDETFFSVAHARKWTAAEKWEDMTEAELKRIQENIDAATEHCLTAAKAAQEGGAE